VRGGAPGTFGSRHLGTQSIQMKLLLPSRRIETCAWSRWRGKGRAAECVSGRGRWRPQLIPPQVGNLSRSPVNSLRSCPPAPGDAPQGNWGVGNRRGECAFDLFGSNLDKADSAPARGWFQRLWHAAASEKAPIVRGRRGITSPGPSHRRRTPSFRAI